MVRVAAVILLSLVSTATLAQEDPYLSPTRGGTEGGIPALRSEIRPRGGSGGYGYLVAVYGRGAIDPALPTHVLVVGYADASGLLFQSAATALAHKYAELYPSEQVVMVTVNELAGSENRRRLERWGFRVLTQETNALGVDELNAELRSLRQIASFDMFSHSNEHDGAKLNFEFVSPFDQRLEAWRSRFTADAYAIFHGCNSGWSLAPAYARAWRIPVAGSFTGTHFQRLHSTGRFFPFDELLSPPGPFARINDKSYNSPRECSSSSCLRMKPDAHAYDGMWGQKEDGISFYKFFCRGVVQADCDRRLARSLMSFISERNLNVDSSIEDFKAVLLDFMCPIHKDRDWRERCIRSTERALALGRDHYSPFFGRSVQCDFESCRTSAQGEPTTTYMNEIKAYLRGFERLRKNPARFSH